MLLMLNNLTWGKSNQCNKQEINASSVCDDFDGRGLEKPLSFLLFRVFLVFFFVPFSQLISGEQKLRVFFDSAQTVRLTVSRLAIDRVFFTVISFKHCPYYERSP